MGLLLLLPLPDWQEIILFSPINLYPHLLLYGLIKVPGHLGQNIWEKASGPWCVMVTTNRLIAQLHLALGVRGQEVPHFLC